MPGIMIDKVHPVQVTPVGGAINVLVENISEAKLYYLGEPNGDAVSATNKTGELTKGQTLTVEYPTWFLANEGAGVLFVPAGNVESIGTAQLGPESVTAAKLATNAVQEAKINATAVASAKVKVPTVPVVSGTEGTVTVGTSGVGRSVLAAWSSEKVAGAKIKIKHTLATEYAYVEAMFLLTSKKAKEQLPYATWIKEVKVLSATELEVVLEKEPAAAKEEYIFMISG